MISFDKKIRKELLPFIPIARTMVKLFGEKIEIVLHDLEKPHSSVVAIIGNVTNRELGAPVTSFLLEQLNKVEVEDSVYFTATTDGRKLKSSTTFIRNDNRNIIGCFCVNFLIEHFEGAIRILEDFSHIDIDSGRSKNERFNKTIDDVVSNILEEVLENRQIPIEYYNKEDRLEIIRKLDERGLFLVKGSINEVAERFKVSKFTIYAHLDEIK